MKIFERDGKINFVDDNNVFVGYYYQSGCCEEFGYVLTEENPTCVDALGNFSNQVNPDGFQFDKTFFQEREANYGSTATFRLLKDEKEIFLTLYNYHNGYYGHGFEFKVEGKLVREGCI